MSIWSTCRIGAPPLAQAALITGEPEVFFDPIPSAIEQIKSGNLRALAVTSTTSPGRRRACCRVGPDGKSRNVGDDLDRSVSPGSSSVRTGCAEPAAIAASHAASGYLTGNGAIKGDFDEFCWA